MAITSLERRWLLLVFDAILPADACPELPIGARDIPLDRFARDFFAVTPALQSLGLRLALWALVLVFTPLVLRRPRTFAGATPDERRRVLDRLAQSRIYSLRELPALLKLIASMGFFGHPEVQRRLGLRHLDTEPAPWFRDEAAR